MILYTKVLLIFIMIFPKINIISIGGNAAGIRIEDFLIAIYILAELLVYSRTKEKLVTSSKLLKITYCFSIFLIACFISTIYGFINGWVTLKLGILYFFRKLEYFLLIIIGYRVFLRIKDIPKFFNKFDYVLYIHLLFSVLQMNGLMGSFNKGEVLDTLTQGRITSTFNGSYEFSAFLLLFFPMYFYNLINGRGSKSRNIINILIIIFCIYISQSRTSLIVLGIIAVLMLIKIGNKKAKSIFYKIVIIVIASFLLFSIFSTKKLNFQRFYTLNLERNKRSV